MIYNSFLLVACEAYRNTDDALNYVASGGNINYNITVLIIMIIIIIIIIIVTINCITVNYNYNIKKRF